jgi:CheY-like chemotaxis protein
MTILIVDDDNDDIEIFTEAVKTISTEINCLRACDGTEAIQLLENINPDIIFLDINMPGMDGGECLSVIKKKETFKNLPVVIYSTSPDMIDFAQYEGLNVCSLKKDVSYLNTVIAIKKILNDLKLIP